jgi:hypothetical protein
MRALQCKDRERVLRSEDPALLAAFELHAAGCAACRNELEMWRNISATARGLQKSWDSPLLWPSIQRALEAEARSPRTRTKWERLDEFWTASRPWVVAPALALLLALMIGGTWMVVHRPENPLPPDAQRRLLTEQAVREVEKSEAAYIDSIRKLSALAAPKVDSPKTPLLATYREKLSVLDAAIDDCRAQVNGNPANPQLRQELLAMYREKQETLRQVLGED